MKLKRRFTERSSRHCVPYREWLRAKAIGGPDGAPAELTHAV